MLWLFVGLYSLIKSSLTGKDSAGKGGKFEAITSKQVGKSNENKNQSLYNQRNYTYLTIT